MRLREGDSFVLPSVQLPAGAKQLMFVWVTPGEFRMGSPETETGRSPSERQFTARISHGFWLLQYPVTQGQWLAFANNNPSQFQAVGVNGPVENVTWFEANEFCSYLNTAYERLLPRGFSFSLPTQVQWEYACRAGTVTKYHFGNVDRDLGRFAWHAGNSGGQTHAVGEKEPNAWGFHDMYGNLWEFCQDGATDYPVGEATDWRGPDEVDNRVVRGGSWGTPPETGDFRSACRSYTVSNVRRSWNGFRVTLSFR